ncbi:hypothetical protein Tco_1023457 [Tanacetum coccineum]
MDDPNITMEEYIRLEEEKARRHGRTFNWQTTTYGKMEYCEDEDDSFSNLKTEYPTIVFDDTSDAKLSCEPMVSPLDNNEIDFKISFDESDDADYMVIFDKKSFSYKIISVDNLKTDSKNENDKVNMPSSLSLEPTIGYIDGLDFFKDFKNEFLAIAYNDLTSKSDPLIEPSVSSQHIDKFETSLSEYDEEEQNFLYFNDSFPLDIIFPNNLKTITNNDDNIDVTQLSRKAKIRDDFWQGDNRVHVLDFARLTDGMRQTLTDRLSMVYTGDDGQALFTSHAWRRLFELGGARLMMTEEAVHCSVWLYILSAEDGRDGLERTSMGRLLSSYFHQDLVRRLCPQDDSMHAEGRKSGARLSGGHFIGSLATHFSLVSDEGLRGLSIIARKLPVIDLHKLMRLNICLRVGDTWAWVAPRPERKQAAAAGAHRAAEDAHVVDEGAQAVPAPVQAPQPPPPTPQHWNITQSVIGLREVVESSITEQTRVST